MKLVKKKRLTNQIRRMRFEKGEMTQEEPARRGGCTRWTVNAIEAAKCDPSLELTFIIANGLDDEINVRR